MDGLGLVGAVKEVDGTQRGMTRRVIALFMNGVPQRAQGIANRYYLCTCSVAARCASCL